MSAHTHTHIPLPYRFLFLYFEPIAAFSGALLTFFTPASYLLTLSPTAKYTSDTFPIYAQMTGHLILFAWLQLYLLRATSSVKLWKIVLFGMFMCDVVHVYSSCVGLGPERIYDLKVWRIEEWVSLVTTGVVAVMRLAFCLGVGVGQEEVLGKLKGQ
ncbi:MAG: hypothetical protein Q9219_001294 [cf. Caloplaca sp. 3 TL-2023]